MCCRHTLHLRFALQQSSRVEAVARSRPIDCDVCNVWRERVRPSHDSLSLSLQCSLRSLSLSLWPICRRRSPRARTTTVPLLVSGTRVERETREGKKKYVVKAFYDPSAHMFKRRSIAALPPSPTQTAARASKQWETRDSSRRPYFSCDSLRLDCSSSLSLSALTLANAGGKHGLRPRRVPRIRSLARNHPLSPSCPLNPLSFS